MGNVSAGDWKPSYQVCILPFVVGDQHCGIGYGGSYGVMQFASMAAKAQDDRLRAASVPGVAGAHAIGYFSYDNIHRCKRFADYCNRMNRRKVSAFFVTRLQVNSMS